MYVVTYSLLIFYNYFLGFGLGLVGLGLIPPPPPQQPSMPVFFIIVIIYNTNIQKLSDKTKFIFKKKKPCRNRAISCPWKPTTRDFS